MLRHRLSVAALRERHAVLQRALDALALAATATPATAAPAATRTPLLLAAGGSAFGARDGFDWRHNLRCVRPRLALRPRTAFRTRLR